MSNRAKHRGGRRHHPNVSLASVARDQALSLAPDSPVLAMFKQAAIQLNDRQDRHERLVKLSRDITIESKRIIFLLHSAITKESIEKTVQEAKERLNKLVKGPLKHIGLELEKCPAYLHLRAVTAGFQEYVEAWTLCSLMETKQIISYREVQEELQYIIMTPVEGQDDPKHRTVTTLLPQNEYMLGISDLTGELMRRAINSISSGDSEECVFSGQVVRDLYTGFLGLFGICKELARKMGTTRSNVLKVESAVYALRVRGGEAPATLLLPPPQPHDWEQTNHSDDEGFYGIN
ncbi:translin-associated protein X [Hyposmocoma kahamanoa]|uniref:translin-associated protein X n=1 Tax=Hyposmocoma kahamanoa TaxID=1477025 RepID=UPI000E6D7229|nr:translin-associated protein X [Hyposmocoma kahamanoa]